MSGGNLAMLLSFKYREVRWVIFHRAGLMNLMLPGMEKTRLETMLSKRTKQTSNRIETKRNQPQTELRRATCVPPISSSLQHGFLPAATSSGVMNVCALRLFVSFLSLSRCVILDIVWWWCWGSGDERGTKLN